MFSPIYYYHILYDLRVPSIIVILERVTRAFFFIILCFFLCPRHCIRRCRCGRHAYEKKKIKKRGRVSVACRSFNVTPVPFYFRAPVFGEFYLSKCILFSFRLPYLGRNRCSPLSTFSSGPAFPVRNSEVIQLALNRASLDGASRHVKRTRGARRGHSTYTPNTL